MGDTTWQVWCNPMAWKISSIEIIDMGRNYRHAVSMTLRRPTSCGEALRVVAIKTLKGIPSNHNLFFSQYDRQHVAYAEFKHLSEAQCPTVVLGNIGFALASCFKHLAEYRESTGIDLYHDLQILTTEDQDLMSLSIDPERPITGAQATLIEADAPERMMIIRLDKDTPAPVHTVLNTLLVQSFNDFVLTQ